MLVKELTKGAKKVLITQTKLADGYNYYLTKLDYSHALDNWFVNSDYKQPEDIHSFDEAKRQAKELIQ
jgi:hypothetical protein